MKLKLFSLVVMLATASVVHGQDYKSFRWGLGLGYARPAGDGSSGGILFYTEPSYRVNDKIAVGLRLEGAVMGRVTATGSGPSTNAKIDVSASGSYTVNGQYYLGSSTFRPFVGAGLGLFSLASASGSVSGSSEEYSVAAGNAFGFYPRIGFDISHFTMQLEYNLIPDTKTPYTYSTTNGPATTEVTRKNSYLGFKLGFFIGGGKK